MLHLYPGILLSLTRGQMIMLEQYCPIINSFPVVEFHCLFPCVAKKLLMVWKSNKQNIFTLTTHHTCQSFSWPSLHSLMNCFAIISTTGTAHAPSQARRAGKPASSKGLLSSQSCIPTSNKCHYRRQSIGTTLFPTCCWLERSSSALSCKWSNLRIIQSEVP